MTSFVQPSFPQHHQGIERAEHAVENVSRAVHNFDGARGLATFLLAAVVSALLFAANQMMENWADGHLLAAWLVLWTVAFAALALLAAPIRRTVRQLKSIDGSATYAAWSARRKARQADEKMWEFARQDPRLMADLMRALGDTPEASNWHLRK
ncbi:MAG: hypothetical protein Q7K57_34675 [Burkholderiaceae bacterium]|nr:hypothetical protein [Burkholderiaceae bacterium]